MYRNWVTREEIAEIHDALAKAYRDQMADQPSTQEGFWKATELAGKAARAEEKAAEIRGIPDFPNRNLQEHVTLTQTANRMTVKA